ncbi:type I-F CRISPR-associated helicase Cas3f [Oryzomicrobium sp.]|uniref:type I-F CRISPR-associated helicase Cas3f n=1 Tax=Oryzomicrobium sp. TaxID=1911578 RepID=UPI002FE23E11
MNVLLVSQCTKNALVQTRRIIDQFAERCGERTWQTAITQQGLDTLYRLLRRSARKNTAVACHWIRGKDHSELLWIVGDARRFNLRGATPTNTTRRDVLRSGDENDWHTGEDIALLARLAALFHDLGKASLAFQKKLVSAQPVADPFRHEWVSLRLFAAFVGEDGKDDRAWLERLADPDIDAELLVRDCLKVDDGRTLGPFRTLHTPLARAIGWLVVSHHRLPTATNPAWALSARNLDNIPLAITHDWCGSRAASDKDAEACWRFDSLPLTSRHWRQHAAMVAQAILRRPGLTGEQAARLLSSPYVLHLSRLALMLADHYYSSQPSHARYGDPLKKGAKALYANSRRDEAGKPYLNQRLDEHLIGVEVNAGRLMRALPRLEHSVPRIARHTGLRARSTGAYRWQNAAADLAGALRERSATQGFFGVNMASTGCGKTLANARILYGLADPARGTRFTVALGLRTLTLQTGDAYRKRLELAEEDMAVLVGGAAVRALREQGKAESGPAGSGSESALDLLPEHSYVRYQSSLEDGPLKDWLYPERKGSAEEEAGEGEAEGSGYGEEGRGASTRRAASRGRQASALLDAPVLVCTVDHLMPACESTRGGHQILPMLRLMTSDLVLDEPDDFGLDDLPALARLVHWAGMLGSRVLLSSATLPPALVQGLFLAYCAGRREFQRNRGEAGERLAVCCAWFDEFGTDQGDHGDDEAAGAFLARHNAFVARRIERLASDGEPRRRAELVPLNLPAPTANDAARRRGELGAGLADVLRDRALIMHRRHHGIDPGSGKRVSFGLIRMANIDPLFDTALALFKQGAPAGCRIHLCTYHSRHPLLVRAAIERELDATLDRHDEQAVFGLPSVRQALNGGEEGDHLFIVLATAVAEVGRDHDYDWAIVEPSSMRSIIQLAGRVWRHRKHPCPADAPNIALLDSNFRHHMTGGKGLAFIRPGFEGGDFALRSHRLGEVLVAEQWAVVDARPRIRPRDELDPHGNLADLEHARLIDLMLGASPGNAQVADPVHWWWNTPAHLSGALQRQQPFRRQIQQHCCFALLPDEDDAQVGFWQLHKPPAMEPSPESSRLRQLDEGLAQGPGIASWAVPAYLPALLDLADAMGLEPLDCARRFGTLDLPEGEEAPQLWRYHPMLGVSRAWK